MKKNAVRISTRQLARELGCSQTAVQRRRRQGWDDSEIRLAIGRQQPARKPGEHGESYLDAQRRRMVAAADLREHEARKRAAELVEVAAADSEWQRICSVIQTTILAVPEAVSGKLAAMTDQAAIAALLRSEIRGALQRISDLISGGDEAPAVTGRNGSTK